MCCDWAFHKGMKRYLSIPLFLVVGRILPDRKCDLKCARGCGVGVAPSGAFGAIAALVPWLGCWFERGCYVALKA